MDPLKQMTGYVVLYVDKTGKPWLLNNQAYPSPIAAEAAARESGMLNVYVNRVNVWVPNPAIIQPPEG